MGNSNGVKLAGAVAIAAVLWLLGGFVFGKVIGMVCVVLGIAVIGYTAGSIMNTPSPSTAAKK